MDFSNKFMVVTGTSKGIGRETVRTLAGMGYSVFACDCDKSEKLELEMSELAVANNVQIFPIYFDLKDDSQIRHGAEAIFSKKVHISGLVNVAGISHNSSFGMTTIDDFRRVFQINFFGHVYFTQLMMKMLTRTKNSSLVFVSSVSAMDGNAGQSAYSASKSALFGLSKTLSLEYAPMGVRVNCVAPGVIDTEMTRNLIPKDYEKLMSRVKMGRPGSPQEVAKLICFLLSDSSSYINGQIIRIDGLMQ